MNYTISLLHKSPSIMSDSDILLMTETKKPSAMILQPIKNDTLKKAEAMAGILDEAEIARLKRIAADKTEKYSEQRITQYMLEFLYLPIKRTILMGKNTFVHEGEYDLEKPLRLDVLLKMAQEKMPAVNFTLTLGKRSTLFWGEVGTWRITARW